MYEQVGRTMVVYRISVRSFRIAKLLDDEKVPESMKAVTSDVVFDSMNFDKDKGIALVAEIAQEEKPQEN